MWTKTIKIGGHELTFESGAMARQANGSAIVRCRNAVVMATIVASREPIGADFMPLTVVYQLRMAALGVIPGGFLRREGRASEREILTSRLIDRSIRPLFPETYRHDTQLVVTTLSHDQTVDIESMAILAATTAIATSDIPLSGPVAGLRVISRDGEWTVMPGEAERQNADLDFIISAQQAGIVMAEGSAREVSEDLAIEALSVVQEALQPMFALLEDAQSATAKARIQCPEKAEADASIAEKVTQLISTDLNHALDQVEKLPRYEHIRLAKNKLKEAFEDEAELAQAKSIFDDLKYQWIRDRIVQGKRLDGRNATTIRPITGKHHWLPTPHGSAVFTRGETQAMVTCTLGSDRDAQMIEGTNGVEFKRFLLHYNFPPYSVGEVRPLRGPGRREIGHGHLAWSALNPVLPDAEGFPYTIRIDSIITESNGSSSMATVCGGCLSLMDAGVPIARPVAGIAMGLVKQGEQFVVLSDILGDEDHVGDMDFKVAGSELGITAIQLDNKIGALSTEVMTQGFMQARDGRLHILGEMAKILEKTRDDLAPTVPRAYSQAIPVNRMRSLIGPGGKNIKRIESETGSQVSLDDSGIVRIFAPDVLSLQKARELVDELTGLPKLGESYLGQVTSIKPFGAFVKIFEGIEGLLRAETLGQRSLQNGQRISVTVNGVTSRGQIELTLDS